MKHTIILYLFLLTAVAAHAQQQVTLSYQVDKGHFISLYHLIIADDMVVWQELGEPTTNPTAVSEFKLKSTPNFVTRDVYTDLSQAKTLANYSLYQHNFCYEETTPSMDWQVRDTTLEHLGYACHMATVDFRGRRFQAIFTPEIAIPYGPWKFHGLPGAVLQVTATDSTEMGKVVVDFRGMANSDHDVDQLYADYLHKCKKRSPSWDAFVQDFDQYFEKYIHNEKIKKQKRGYPGTNTKGLQGNFEIFHEKLQSPDGYTYKY